MNNKLVNKSIIIVTILVVLVLSIVVFSNRINKGSRLPTRKPDVTAKTNLHTIPILPQYELDRLDQEIRRVAGLNNASHNLDKYKLMIRDNSLKQTYDDKEFIYTTDFIVDLPSFKQSYRVHDKYYMVPHRHDDDYTLLVTCPHPEDLIYPSFKCTDRIKQEGGTE